MEDYEFKGGNEYSQVVLADVQRGLTKAQKALRDIDHDFAFVEGCELEHTVVCKCMEMLAAVSDSLYAVKKITTDKKPTPAQQRRLNEFDDAERILREHLQELHERRREYINANQLNEIVGEK